MNEAQIWVTFARTALEGFLSAPVGRRPLDAAGENFLDAPLAAAMTADHMVVEFRARYERGEDGSFRGSCSEPGSPPRPTPATSPAPSQPRPQGEQGPSGRGNGARGTPAGQRAETPHRASEGARHRNRRD